MMMRITILNQACLDKDILFKVFHPIEVANNWKLPKESLFYFKDLSKGTNKEEILSMIPLSILLEHENPIIYLRQVFYNSTLLDDFRMLWRVSLPELKEVKKRVGNNRKYLQSIVEAKVEKRSSKFLLDLGEKIKLLDEFISALVEVCTNPENLIIHYINQEF